MLTEENVSSEFAEAIEDFYDVVTTLYMEEIEPIVEYITAFMLTLYDNDLVDQNEQ